MAERTQNLEDHDFSSVTPEDFAALVKQSSAKELDELMRGEPRQRVLAEIFTRMARQFRPENAGSLTALIRWELTGGAGEPTAVYDVTIADGTCAAVPGPTDATPRVTLALGDADFLRLVSGNASPVLMFMTRKLKATGDVALASGLARLFNIPKSTKN
ncbi:SCP2 sterol-binding domain-containing protein [Streptomyces sp. 8K308]|uniref:SCP2 sterol-binding domain-containing protein n=1 Tax=Streptomyces sp. 8K308 TaxID=2530388 RepID=UPI00104E1DF7|nr:SCP2 sterol-binding domain-containing protein [Streptomyces sp. 8K308]TDC28038.1 SCP2 sterol-binding domain-containing protein [Streptomyces sp. 8K308]